MNSSISMKIFKLLFVFLFIILFLFSKNNFAQVVIISTEEQIKEDVQLAPCKSSDRLENVKKLFQKVGANDEYFSTEKFKDGENLVLTLKGSTDEIIYVGAHYDKVDEGCGAIDNWTGITIIAHLYKTLSTYSPKKTYIFVAFDKEEAGLLGSKALVKTITKEKLPKVCSMVNVDSFGFAAPQVADNMSNGKMLKSAKELAKQMKFPFSDAAIAGADADSSSFLDRKIPAITFHGLSSNWQKYLHSSNDKISNVDIKSVYFGYRFVLAFIGKIDADNCDEFK